MQHSTEKDNWIIRIENLTKRFGSFIAVDGLNLDIYPGEILGFLGPNGAGKTTSINMISGLSKPDQGSVLYNYNNKPILLRNKRDVLGICPQEIVLWDNLTCLEQLEYLGQMYTIKKQQIKQRALHLLSSMALEDKKNSIAKTLSGGMKRRLNLILALLHDPQIVILDEPEAGLDPQSRVLVRDYIKALSEKENRTVILTTHNMDEAERLADRVAIIDKGKLLKLDTPEALKNTIGKGDRVEIETRNKTAELTEVVTALKSLPGTITLDQQYIFIQLKHASEHLSEILELLKKHPIIIQEIKIRRNTLEDVFIALTGRSLRQ